MALYDLSEDARLHADINPEPKPSQCGIPPPRGCWSPRDVYEDACRQAHIMAERRAAFAESTQTPVHVVASFEDRQRGTQWAKASRQRLGLTLSQMGDTLGVHRQTWWAYEVGRTYIPDSVHARVDALVASLP